MMIFSSFKKHRRQDAWFESFTVDMHPLRNKSRHNFDFLAKMKQKITKPSDENEK